jgi:virulence factor Mce-like protein
MPVIGVRLRALVAALALGLVAPACSLVGAGGGTYTITAYFPKAVAVYQQADVRVLGLPAGTVHQVTTQGDRVKVVLHIRDSVPVPKGAKAAIIPQSLIGARYVQLMPAWTEGQPKAKDGDVIPEQDTIIPVEPDEALGQLKKFLDTLDPSSLGRLVNNAADDLQGNGANLNSALDHLSQLVGTFADKDKQLLDIVDNFDKFTATLTTRDQQLGTVLDAFSAATGVLAAERRDLEAFVTSLADLSKNGLVLVAKHSTDLRTDIETLTRLAQSIDTNLGAVGQLLDSGPLLVNGIIGAWNPELRAFNLRSQFGPLAYSALQPLLSKLIPGFQLPCTPVLQSCPTVAGNAAGRAVPATITPGHTPVDDILGLAGAPVAVDTDASGSAADGGSTADRVAGGLAGIGSFLRGAASSLLGGSS